MTSVTLPPPLVIPYNCTTIAQLQRDNHRPTTKTQPSPNYKETTIAQLQRHNHRPTTKTQPADEFMPPLFSQHAQPMVAGQHGTPCTAAATNWHTPIGKYWMLRSKYDIMDKPICCLRRVWAHIVQKIMFRAAPSSLVWLHCFDRNTPYYFQRYYSSCTVMEVKYVVPV